MMMNGILHVLEGNSSSDWYSSWSYAGQMQIEMERSAAAHEELELLKLDLES